MKLCNWSKAGITVGFSFAALSALRYFALFPDLDKALSYVTIGGLIMAISWLYNQQLDLNNKLYAVEEFLQDNEQHEQRIY